MAGAPQAPGPQHNMRGEEVANMSSRGDVGRWTRRDVLGALGRTAALGVLGAGVGPAVARAGAASRDFNWRKHAGTRLRFLGWNELWSMAMDKKVPEFEELTGIRAERSPKTRRMPFHSDGSLLSVPVPWALM